MTCEQFQEYLAAYIEGSLAEPTAAETRVHLQSCEACRAQADALAPLHRRLLHDGGCARRSIAVQGVMDQVLQAQSLRLRSAIRRRRLTWASLTTAVAAILLLLVVGLLMLSSPSVTLADVRPAVADKTWVHVIWDAGRIREQWICLSDGKSYARRDDDEIVYVDNAANIRRCYSPLGAVINEDTPAEYTEGKVPQWKPKTAWEYLVQDYENWPKTPGSDVAVERHEDNIDGKSLVRFDRYHNDAMGKSIAYMRLWADPVTRVPVRVSHRLQLGERKTPDQEWSVGVYDFPATGPNSIYDLGVPRDARIVKSDAKESNPEVMRIRQTIQAAAQRFPSRYCAVVWLQGNGQPDATIDVVYRDSPKFRQSRYFNMSPQIVPEGAADYHVPAGSTTEAILKWAEKQAAVDDSLCDGEREYSRNNPLPWQEGKARPSARVRMTNRAGDWMPAGFLLNWNSHPDYFQWPLVYSGNRPAEILADAPAGCVGLRYGDQISYRSDYYMDLQHDYICVREVHWRNRKGQWEKESEDRFLDFHRLPDGQWYAAKGTTVHYPDPEKGISGSESTWTIDVKVLGEGEFPPDIFNGAKLVEGADVHVD